MHITFFYVTLFIVSFLGTSLVLRQHVVPETSSDSGYTRVQTSTTDKPCGMRLVDLPKGRQMQFDENCTVNVWGAE